ncbi:Glutathione peroxidase 2 [Actinomortierella wolfii]|nr:Glutathione peroxidase 2 [Actinomortierella wolfii]
MSQFVKARLVENVARLLRSSAPLAHAPMGVVRSQRPRFLWQKNVPAASYKNLVKIGSPSSVLFSTASATTLSPGETTTSTPTSNNNTSSTDKNNMPVDVNSFFDLKAKNKAHQEISMKDFENKVILVVNVASKCGFTKQYAGLEELYKKYKDRGLVVIGFPCNQFGGQEPGTEEEIESFCTVNFGVTFPLMAKIDVNGEKEDPVYAWLKQQKAGLLGLQRIKWNFEKFLIDRNGKVVERYSSITTPEAIAKDIEKLL